MKQTETVFLRIGGRLKKFPFFSLWTWFQTGSAYIKNKTESKSWSYADSSDPIKISTQFSSTVIIDSFIFTGMNWGTINVSVFWLLYKTS